MYYKTRLTKFKEAVNVNTVKYEQKDFIAYVTLDRPDMLNAFNYEMLEQLRNVMESIQIHPDIRLVIITGSGDKAFSVGADLKERKTLPDTLVKRNLNRFGEVFTLIEQLPQPTICVLNGYAFGGGLELALACDFRIAADTVSLGLTETGLGIIPGAGGTQRLPRLIGEAKALELILTAKRMTAHEALDYGVVTKVAPVESLHEVTADFAALILRNAPIAIQQAKFAVKQGMKTDIQQVSKLNEKHMN